MNAPGSMQAKIDGVEALLNQYGDKTPAKKTRKKFKENKKFNNKMEDLESTESLRERLAILNQYENLTGSNITAGREILLRNRQIEKIGEKVLEELEEEVLKDIKIKTILHS